MAHTDGWIDISYETRRDYVYNTGAHVEIHEPLWRKTLEDGTELLVTRAGQGVVVKPGWAAIVFGVRAGHVPFA